MILPNNGFHHVFQIVVVYIIAEIVYRKKIAID